MPSLRETLTRKVGPAPIWVYGMGFILGVAWLLMRSKQKAAAQRQQQGSSGSSSNLGNASNLLNQFQMAYPMPYSSDTFVNIKNDVPAPTVNVPVTVGGPTINNPPPVVAPPAAPPPPPPPPQVAPPPPPPPKQTSITYTVQRGDTLWGIAQRFLGGGSRYGTIYNANKGSIEAIARQHGFSSSHGGHWIFPGERLVIPV